VRQNRSKVGSSRRVFANGTKPERNAANGTLAFSDLHIRAASDGIEGLLSGVNRKAFARREVFSV
jgi:hypothetical protein